MAEPPDNGSTPGEQRKRPTGKRKPTLGNPDADPQRIHREYVERHFGGGEPPTPEAYEQGVEEWMRLPGAVSRQPGELRGQGDRGADNAETSEPDAPGGDSGDVSDSDGS